MISGKRLEIKELKGRESLCLDGKEISYDYYKIRLTVPNAEDFSNSGNTLSFPKKYLIYDFDHRLPEALSGVKISDIDNIEFEFGEKFVQLPDFTENSHVEFDSKSGVLRLVWMEDFYNWKYNFSPMELIWEIEKIFGLMFFESPEEPIYSQLVFRIKELDAEFSEIILNTIKMLQSIIEFAWESLSRNNEDSVSFNFPNHLKFACEQYLLYFGQFLSDVGQQASVNITHQGATTLFEFVPNDKQTSLVKIREALNIYLNMSSSNPSAAGSLSLAESRYQAVIIGYQAQLMSLQAQENARQLEIMAGRMTITQQQNVIDQQGKFILQQGQTLATQANALAQANVNVNIFAQALQDKENEHEGLVGDIVKVKPYEVGPLVLDVPAALRRVKELFSKKDGEES